MLVMFICVMIKYLTGKNLSKEELILLTVSVCLVHRGEEDTVKQLSSQQGSQETEAGDAGTQVAFSLFFYSFHVCSSIDTVTHIKGMPSLLSYSSLKSLLDTFRVVPQYLR